MIKIRLIVYMISVIFNFVINVRGLTLSVQVVKRIELYLVVSVLFIILVRLGRLYAVSILVWNVRILLIIVPSVLVKLYKEKTLAGNVYAPKDIIKILMNTPLYAKVYFFFLSIFFFSIFFFFEECDSLCEFCDYLECNKCYYNRV